MKMKTMGVKCDECGKFFLAGTRPDGMPNGIGFMMEDGSVHNVCADCLTKMEDEKMPIKPSAGMGRIKAIMDAYDKKLKEVLTEEEYKAFTKETAKQVFLAEVMACPNEDFKRFVMSNFESIIEGGDAMYEALKNMQKGADDGTERNS